MLHDREKKFIPSVVRTTDDNYTDIRDIYNYIKSIYPLFKLRYDEKYEIHKNLLVAIDKYKVYEVYEDIIESDELLNT